MPKSHFLIVCVKDEGDPYEDHKETCDHSIHFCEDLESTNATLWKMVFHEFCEKMLDLAKKFLGQEIEDFSGVVTAFQENESGVDLTEEAIAKYLEEHGHIIISFVEWNYEDEFSGEEQVAIFKTSDGYEIKYGVGEEYVHLTTKLTVVPIP